jgi:S-formylglutathione hydrolase FrmB
VGWLRKKPPSVGRLGGNRGRSRLLSAFFVAVAAMLGMFGFATPTAANEAQVVDHQQVADRVVELTVETPAFADPTKVHVILPTGYDAQPSRRWPVTYFTAGTMNRFNSFTDALGGVALTAGFPSIIVSPDANSGYWSDWYNAGSLGPPKYETYVIDQLVPLIDERFRTLAGRDSRAIFGISMGGYGAMMLAARHPDRFVAAATLSGAVDSNLPVNGSVLSISSTFDGAAPDAIYGPRSSQEVRWRGHNPLDLAQNLDGLDLHVLTANGTLNPDIGEGGDPNDTLSCAVERGVYSASVNLHERFDELGVSHGWRDYGPGCHSIQNFRREVVETVGALAETFADPPPRPAEVDYRSIDPRFEVWGWSVAADPARALEFLRLRGGRSGVRLNGSGLTRVTTPPWYRELKKVDVDGRSFAVRADGRLRFTVDLGPAHKVQQYAPGAATTMKSRRVGFAPHAVIRIVSTERKRGRVGVCLRSIGGVVPRALVEVRGGSARARVGVRSTCLSLPADGRPRLLTVSGNDSFGHRVKTIARIAGG